MVINVLSMNLITFTKHLCCSAAWCSRLYKQMYTPCESFLSFCFHSVPLTYFIAFVVQLIPPPLPPSPKKATITKCCIHPLPVLPNTPQGKILRTTLCIVSLTPRFLACSPLAHHVVTTDWGHGVCCSELSSFFPLKSTYRSHTLWCFQARDGLPNKTNSHDKISETTQIVQKLSISNPLSLRFPLLVSELIYT